MQTDQPAFDGRLRWPCKRKAALIRGINPGNRPPEHREISPHGEHRRQHPGFGAADLIAGSTRMHDLIVVTCPLRRRRRLDGNARARSWRRHGARAGTAVGQIEGPDTHRRREYLQTNAEAILFDANALLSSVKAWTGYQALRGAPKRPLIGIMQVSLVKSDVARARSNARFAA